MKPKNKKQQHIVELSGRLRPLTTPQMTWALSNTIKHYGYRLKSGMCTCMKCGHEWLETRNGMCLCPECGTRIEMKDTKERVIRDKSYFNVITTMGDYQVVRMFLMMVEMRKGMKASPAYLEVGSYWIDPKGHTTVVGLQRTLGHYIDSFAFGSPLEHSPRRGSVPPPRTDGRNRNSSRHRQNTSARGSLFQVWRNTRRSWCK